MYNKSEIMKAAWNNYKALSKYINAPTFGECLRRAWKAAKEALKAAQEITREVGRVYCGSALFMAPGYIAMTGCKGWILSGKTYPVRRDLKRMGFEWDIEARNWFTESREVALNFAKL